MLAFVRRVVVLSVGAAATAAAQGPGGPPMGPRPEDARARPAAQMLLANTGTLDLTDAQVVKLAAIARRTEARRRGMRQRMWGGMGGMGRGPGMDRGFRRRDDGSDDAERARPPRAARPPVG